MLKRRGFTLIEVLTVSVISLFIALGAWSIYIIGWQWWSETVPNVEAERITRIAISTVERGTIDSSAGLDSIGASTYDRRNGIAWAVYDPAISSNISVNDRIDFGLEPDTGNERSFYLGTDLSSGLNYVYYSDNNGAIHRINSTRGITGIRFDKFTDAAINRTYVRITATVDRTIVGTRGVPYRVLVTQTDLICLRNIV